MFIDEPPSPKAMNGEKDAGLGSGDEAEEEGDDSVVYYDKAKSFFDNISCEATERSKG